LSHGRDGRPLLDDGRGAARMSVLRHKHEIVSGRTSSIAQLITGYDAEGCVLNYAGVAPPTPAEIATLARKVRVAWTLYGLKPPL
jgi:GTPase